MITDDPVLPAAVHLTEPTAAEVLAPAVALSGQRLAWCRPAHVQYRPGSDLVVRYRAGLVDAHGTETESTLLAATTRSGAHPGTIPVEAHHEGRTLVVGVWQWPFDPMLPALDTAVRADCVAPLLGTTSTPRLEVVAYRPTERAVVRVTDEHRERYLKVVPPAMAAAIIERHERLGAAGIPVPRVIAHDADSGWIAMEALAGPTLRERLKAGPTSSPNAQQYLDLVDALASVDLPGAARTRSRLDDAPAHAAMLATVLPPEADRLAAIGERCTSAAAARRHHTVVDTVVHGDLHEGQLVVDGDHVVGLLDIDDAGPGDPLDDLATMLAHLRFRALSSGRPDIAAYADTLRSAWSDRADGNDLDVVTAAALVGLATGPFRIQQDGWRAVTRAVLDEAELLVDAEHEQSLRPASSPINTNSAR